MSNKPFRARQKAARAYQAAHPGTSYTRALRLSTSSDRRPLTAVLGAGRDRSAVTVNLECGSAGGAGPHCTVVGATTDNTYDMMRYLGACLAASQQPGDVEFISAVSGLCAGDSPHTCCDSDLFSEVVDEHLLERQRLLRALNCADVDKARQAGHRIASTVVFVGPTQRDLVDSRQLERWTRVARSAGSSIVVGLESPTAATYPPDDPLGRNAFCRLLDDAFGPGTAANLSTAIFHLGDDCGCLTVLDGGPAERRRGGTSTVFTMPR